ncbi:hypothetical protein WV31_10500 [Magnetospirillum sp. ME-1]|uniref:hypothetical protein n=1 Tax=Magnetospirillum sp. ME-1 TaxID=1639348 RepID=UPI000A17E66E|nr:hypothetical protein [Magnetospirillum sp. ME-1]ARJ66057.1 hypothetical protein WV31_10500 [Magnetospirillum sp. ME-1]
MRKGIGWGLGAATLAMTPALAMASLLPGGKCTGGILERGNCLVTKVSGGMITIAWGVIIIALVVVGVMTLFGKKDLWKVWLAFGGGALVLILLPFLMGTFKELGEPEIVPCGVREKCILANESPPEKWLLPSGVPTTTAFACFRVAAGSVEQYTGCLRASGVPYAFPCSTGGRCVQPPGEPARAWAMPPGTTDAEAFACASRPGMDGPSFRACLGR